MTYLAVPLEAGHDRSGFDCGRESLNHYLLKQAGQDMKRRLAVAFVLTGADGKVIGYYTLSSDGLPFEEVPAAVRKTMPRSYKNLPTILLGRLAVDRRRHGEGLGELLLLDALKRSYDLSLTDVGAAAVVADPIDDGAAAFYAQYGFVMLPDRGRMFIPMKTVRLLYKS